ncbi:MAG: UvrD-helicase domain-containing protein [Clostridia bacterium]|nr:UvrD-helicase domain-containing protein [Clostridia bacterium]
MNSKVIKCVAGAGKTTYSEKYMKENKKGIYLAFNNSVVSELRDKGYLCKTIDSLFSSFIIPKFTSIIPLIASGCNIKYIEAENVKEYQRGILNIRISKDGSIYNKGKKTQINLKMKNEQLHLMKNLINGSFIKYIFNKDCLNISNQQREGISLYIIENYSNQVIELLNSRFSYIIIDEAQDLKGYREEFARLLYNSNIELVLLGDDNQNINGGGNWFESLEVNEYKARSHRCPDKICAWIRENLSINIYGNSNNGSYKIIAFQDALMLDDGNRVLLYSANKGKNNEIIGKWKGRKLTIKKSKGSTIDKDVVIIGESLNKKNLYTAITRTRKSVYSSITKIN